MAIIKGINRLIMPAASKGMPEAISYVRELAWNTSTVDIVKVDNIEYFGTLGGSDDSVTSYMPGFPFYTQPILQATILTSSTILPVTNSAGDHDPLKYWYNPLYPEQIHAWVQIDLEIIQYTDINPANTSASGYDEFVTIVAAPPAYQYRGQFNSIVAGHTAPTVINPVTAGDVTDIEFDTEAAVFTVKSKHILMQDQSGTYGADGFQEMAITYVNSSIPSDQVSIYETENGYINIP
jgi:hypothetical protein